MTTTISRRTLAKSLLAAGATVALPAAASATTPDAQPVSVGEWVRVHPGVWRATIGSPEKFTPVSSRLMPPQSSALDKLTAPAGPPQVRLTATAAARGCTVRIPLQPGEEIFGLGLQFLSFSQRGSKKVTRVNADPKVDTGDSNAPVPFFVTTSGTGFFIDTARYTDFYFGTAHPRPTEPIAPASSDSIAPKYSSAGREHQDDFIMVNVPVACGVDVYCFDGPDMLTAVRRYNLFSGGGCIPPEWGLGFWYRMKADFDSSEALALAHGFRERQIPCDVIGLEPGWQSHAYSCTFVWDKVRFPDPHAFLRSARAEDFHVNLWEHAFTYPSSPLFSSLEPFSGNFGVWNGLVPDFAGQPARNIFAKFHRDTLVSAGVSGFKLDECDNSDYTGGWSFPECSSFPSGIDGEQMHSVFGLRYQQAIWDAFRGRAGETYGLVRSSGALGAPYPFVLYSDLYGHREYIRALVNSGFSGLLWCPEVRQAENDEDLIRRLQSVVFSPLAQVDCWYMKSPPWKQVDRAKNNADQFAPDWQQLEARCREIIGWRMQLVPYLTSAFQRYAADGVPPFRALVLDTPHDQRLYKLDDQYMVGDRMMVAPLFAGEPGRTVTIPHGEWHDFWTGASVQGGTVITLPASTDKIPVYVRSGSLIPWADVGQHAGAKEARRIAVRVYGDGSLPFSMRTAAGELRLSWKNGVGVVHGNVGEYSVYRWDAIG
ncbi:MAG: TIM-barrel domain-containing protein [Acidobacteriota bacterium]